MAEFEPHQIVDDEAKVDRIDLGFRTLYMDWMFDNTDLVYRDGERIGYRVEDTDYERIRLAIPTWTNDISQHVDLIRSGANVHPRIYHANLTTLRWLGNTPLPVYTRTTHVQISDQGIEGGLNEDRSYHVNGAPKSVHMTLGGLTLEGLRPVRPEDMIEVQAIVGLSRDYLDSRLASQGQ